jgi:YgiT-type zinc finger domain-containing protein
MIHVAPRKLADEAGRQGQCPNCEQEMVQSTSALQFARQGIAFNLAGVPAEICPECGEAYIDPRLARPLWDYAMSAFQEIASMKAQASATA